MELQREHPDPWSLSPARLQFELMAMRERQREDKARAAEAATVPRMEKKDAKAWWKRHGNA